MHLEVKKEQVISLPSKESKLISGGKGECFTRRKITYFFPDLCPSDICNIVVQTYHGIIPQMCRTNLVFLGGIFSNWKFSLSLLMKQHGLKDICMNTSGNFIESMVFAQSISVTRSFSHFKPYIYFFSLWT